MDNDSQEKTLEDRARAVLDQLTIPTSEGVLRGEPLPEWLAEPWAAALVDPHDPNFPDSVVKAESWLQSL
jgi:hypothetical protein